MKKNIIMGSHETKIDPQKKKNEYTCILCGEPMETSQDFIPAEELENIVTMDKKDNQVPMAYECFYAVVKELDKSLQKFLNN